jgi:hypothetical protein
MKNENLFLSIIVVIISVLIIWWALKAALFIGWAIGGGIGVLIAILFLFGLLDIGWLLGLLAFIILFNFIFDLF